MRKPHVHLRDMFFIDARKTTGGTRRNGLGGRGEGEANLAQRKDQGATKESQRNSSYKIVVARHKSGVRLSMDMLKRAHNYGTISRQNLHSSKQTSHGKSFLERNGRLKGSRRVDWKMARVSREHVGIGHTQRTNKCIGNLRCLLLRQAAESG